MQFLEKNNKYINKLVHNNSIESINLIAHCINIRRIGTNTLFIFYLNHYYLQNNIWTDKILEEYVIIIISASSLLHCFVFEACYRVSRLLKIIKYSASAIWMTCFRWKPWGMYRTKEQRLLKKMHRKKKKKKKKKQVLSSSVIQ